MTDRIREIEARLAKVTPVPWPAISIGRANADMIAHAPGDLRYLLDRVRELERELEERNDDVTE